MIKALQVWLLAVYLLPYIMELIVRHFHNGERMENSNISKLVFVLLFWEGFKIKRNAAYSLSELFSRNHDLSCFPLYGSALV